MVRGGVRPGVIALALLVLAAALCTKALGAAPAQDTSVRGTVVGDAVVGNAAVADAAVAAQARAASAPDTAAADSGDGSRCAKKPPSTGAHPAPRPAADPVVPSAARAPDAPHRVHLPRAADARAGPAPAASRHILLSVLRI